MITKISLGTLKPIAPKLQKKDQDIFQAYSMVDDTIKAVAMVKSNIERPNVMSGLKTHLD